SMTLGMAFAAGWTPCIGPILGGIIGLAATSGGWKSGLILSSFYAAGLAIPFLLTGLGINRFLGFYANFRKHLHKVEVVSGVMLMVIGVVVAFGYTTRLTSSKLASLLPNLEALIKVQPPAPDTATTTPPPPPPSGFAAAPDFALNKLDGPELRLSELRGRVVMLNFWATWCGPCRTEIPELNAMQKELQDQGLTIVGVSWDDTREGVLDFQKEIPLEYTILLGGEGVQSLFNGIPSLPTTYIIDRDGRIRQKIIGARGRPFFEAAIKPLLNEQATTARR
ncbi:MAG: redoxin domain-containing protein, partial [Pyrinomonadaceae bacterium]|nr:redoxin domain-containing protein [Pyrinomonadaceae bacterium]